MKALPSLLFLSAAALFGQAVQTGTLRGFLLDASGASVPKASVSISNETRLIVRSAQSGHDGGYLFQSLPPSTYELVVEAAGFSKVIQRNIVLHSGDNLRIDMNLTPSPVTTAIEVVGSTGPPINTVNASIDHVVPAVSLTEVLLPRNDALAIAAFLPGARSEWSQDGQAIGQNVILVDGSNEGDESISDYGTRKIHPPADTVAEFRVSQNSYTADLGRASGARFEFVTKSGTDQFHGSAYWFRRQEQFNANNWGATSKAQTRQNEAGYTLGGPLKKEKVYFFFTSYYRRINNPSSGLRTWPTQAQLKGDFSAWLNPRTGLSRRTVKDPATGTAFPGNTIPATRLNRNALAYLDLFYPSVADPYALANNGYTTSPLYNNDDYYSPRFDFRVTQKLNMYARYTRNTHYETYSWVTIEKKYHPDAYLNPGAAHGLTLAGTYLVSPRFLIDFQSAFLRNVGGRADLFPGSDLRSNVPGWSGKLLFPEANTLYLPQVTLSSGYTTVGRSPGKKTNTYGQGNAAGNFAVQGQRHNVKFGFDEVYRFKRMDDYGTPNIGTFAFDGSATGDALADLLLGRARSFSQSSALTRWQALAGQHALYGQDEIKVNKKLTVTLGLRWEGDGAYRAMKTEKLQKWANWLPSLYNVAAAHKVDPVTGVIVGQSNFMNGIQVVDEVGSLPKKNWMPRVSIAYAPRGSETAIRAGYGIFFDHQGTISLLNNPPYQYGVTVFNSDFDDPSGGVQTPRPLAISAVSVPWKTPRTQKYSVGVQRQMRGLLMDVSYVGSRSTQQRFTPNINQPEPNADVLARRVVIDAVRPYYGLGSISMTRWGTNARYNSLQAQLRRPLSKGLFVLAAYTLARQTVDGGTTDPRNRAYDAGEAAGHHIFSLASSYAPSAFANWSRWPRLALHGWELSTEVRLLSGGPLAVWMQTDTTGTGRTVRADWAGSVNQARTMDRWFDTAAFSAPASLRFGNSPVDAIWGPGSTTWNLGVFRNFQIRERLTFQYRLEAYNVLNHFNLNNPNTSFGQPNFGKITSKSGPRNLQMALRLTF